MRERLQRWTGIILAAALLAGIACLPGFRCAAYAEETRGNLTDRFLMDERNRIIDGVKYDYNERLYVLLFMGIDWSEEKLQELIDTYYPGQEPTLEQIKRARRILLGGQADFLQMVVIDSDNKTITRIPINRDTIAEVDFYSPYGYYSGTAETQITLSHSYGDGYEESCEHTVTAVERLFGGIDITSYVAMDMDAIQILNDTLGGVTVTMAEDWTEIDPSFTKGATVTLHGSLSHDFVRARMEVGNGTNLERMARQEIYMSAALKLLKDKVYADNNFIGVLYDALGTKMVTDIKRGRAINEAAKAVSYTLLDKVVIEGTSGYDEEGFNAFYPDQEALTALVLRTFYNVSDY